MERNHLRRLAGEEDLLRKFVFRTWPKCCSDELIVEREAIN